MMMRRGTTDYGLNVCSSIMFSAGFVGQEEEDDDEEEEDEEEVVNPLDVSY